MPETSSSSLSKRLRKLAAEIQALDRELKSNASVNADDLGELRQEVDKLRLTSWTVNELLNAREAKKNPQGVLRLLTAERLRRFRQMVEDLCSDLERDGSSWPSHMLDQIQESANLLRQRLGLPAFRRAEAGSLDVDHKR
jgi:hypothetical protein